MSSKLEIMQLALAACGSARLVASPTESTQEARLCSQFYGFARDATLADLDWPWARKRAALAARGAPPAAWGHSYALPSDCLAPREIWSGLRAPREDQRIPWELGAAPSGQEGLLFTDQESAILVYTARLDVPELYPPAFAQAAAEKLASLIAGPLTGDPARAAALEDRYRIALARAAADALRTGQEDRPPVPRLISVRRG